MTKQMRNADRPLEHRIAAAIGRLARGDRRARIPDDATDLVEVLHACKREIERLRAGNAGMTETIEWTPASEKQPAFGKTVLVCINDTLMQRTSDGLMARTGSDLKTERLPPEKSPTGPRK